ncbi:hypothetical protein N9N67_07675 [Bacteriovoracaceae bacterium]|nr:hypothetical protein [Bacteriovoracaceae bacterium]
MKTNHLTILGPCSLESMEQIEPIILLAQKFGIFTIRAHLFKPRTNPDSFQGLHENGIELVKNIKTKYPGLKLVEEVLSLKQYLLTQDYFEYIQVGARNMQNFELLKDLATHLLPHQTIILKRGFANTLEEWIQSARYLIKYGLKKEQIILCERGSRSLTSSTGMHPDFICAFQAKHDYDFQVIFDASHSTKEATYVLPMAEASQAFGLDGLLIECHPQPMMALSDKDQAIDLEALEQFLSKFYALKEFTGKKNLNVISDNQ